MIIIKSFWRSSRKYDTMKLMKQRDLLLKQKRREKPMEAKELAKLAIQALEDKKAEDVKVIDISDVSTIILSSPAEKTAVRYRLCAIMWKRRSEEPAPR